MIKVIVCLLSVLALAGCGAVQSYNVTQASSTLRKLCEAGNVQACATLVNTNPWSRGHH